jgi:thiosulfate reductase cytochrome b subunit
VGDIAWVSSSASAIPARTVRARHSALVRVTHWITTLCFLALLISGFGILISHPRFYWGETGNINTTPLFKIPIPASRNLVPTGYGFVLPDLNGWGRYLHFQAAWIVVLTGVLYVIYSLLTGHLQKNLFPRKADFSWRVFSSEIASHLRFARPPAAEAWSYNLLQRIAYLFLIVILFPVVVWTGLAMSPAFVSVVPATVTAFGGQQSARTIHFFLTLALLLFLLIHLVMIGLAGFWNRTQPMITGRPPTSKEPI